MLNGLVTEGYIIHPLIYQRFVNCICFTLREKVPLHSMEAQGERRYSSYTFMTSALDGGEWPASRPSPALPPGKGTPTPIGQEAGWAPEPVWTHRREEKFSAFVGDRTPFVLSVVKYTYWATRLLFVSNGKLIYEWWIRDDLEQSGSGLF
jgi:hypothetical protein